MLVGVASAMMTPVAVAFAAGAAGIARTVLDVAKPSCGVE